MINASKLFLIGCVAVSSLSSPRLEARDYRALDEITEERRKLSLREVAVKKRLNNIAVIDRTYARIKKIQLHYVLSKDGLSARQLKAERDLTAWITSWKDIITVTQEISAENLTVKSMEFRSKFADLQKEFAEIRNRSAQSYAFTLKGHSEITTEKKIPENLVVGYSAKIVALNTHHSKVKETLEGSLNYFGVSHFDNISQKLEPIAKYLDTKIDRMKIEFPELKQAIDEARSYLRYLDDTEKKFLYLRRQAGLANSLINQGKILTAEKLIKEIERGSKKLISSITDSDLRDDLKGTEVDTVEKVISQLKRNIQPYLNDLHFEFLDFFLDQRAKLSFDCRREKTAALRNCDLLRILNAMNLNDDNIEELSKSELGLIEEQLIKAELGPRYEVAQ